MTKEKVTPREVAVALPFCRDQDGAVHICLVTSRKHDGKYVLPKGGVEKSDADSRSAAIREMWEEAGLRPSAQQQQPGPSNSIRDHKPHKHSPSPDPSSDDFVPRAVYTAHQVQIERGAAGEESQWPEMDERARAWFPLDVACEKTAWRGDIGQLLRAAQF
ncbi:hypothetical protein FA10DRAFT_265849 [Acaromyces ingoldii]|uniref:Nudix hydrolase domain-containing protein n=1 Tax=Acaromyces ingoldii TaxID=215250 RepID=A0A316YSE1_9BASI|nr:hypothetical protein FA10DRAFT_265849 [Acaromyces ingoldii]PWN92042.1 hypothetical protein FA10DRAFT_265849 [Acaromyces ingoldii]